MNTIQALRTVLQLAQAEYDNDPDSRGHADESGEVDEDQQAIDIVEQLIRDMQASSATGVAFDTALYDEIESLLPKDGVIDDTCSLVNELMYLIKRREMAALSARKPFDFGGYNDTDDNGESHGNK